MPTQRLLSTTTLVSIRLMTFVGLVLLTTLVACGGSAGEPETADTPAASEPAPAEEQTVWEAGGLTITPLGESPEFPEATIALSSPADLSIPAGSTNLQFEVGGFGMGEQTTDAATKGIANSGDGQHIHLIIDNGPYSAHYTPEATSELEAGAHVLLAFLGRSYHESVKTPGVFVLEELLVDGASSSFDKAGQHLFYNRPKGSYSGDGAERIMLDFFLVNTELSQTGNRVRATIEGNEFVFSKWQPYVIEGLPSGTVTIQLELIDSAGNVVEGPFNSVTRTIEVEAAEGDA